MNMQSAAPLVERLRGDAASHRAVAGDCDCPPEHTANWQHAMNADEAAAEIERLRTALACAEAALADIGDATRYPGDDVAWCEARAAEALPCVRAALKA
jgi:hypothetical protein